MAGNHSGLPKERINITYKGTKDGMQQDVELPNKLLVLGDFTLREEETPLEDREVISVNKTNFNDVLKAQNLTLDLVVNDPRANEEKSINLTFDSLKDFEPEQVAEKVPHLKELLKLRNALGFLRGPMGNIPAFRKQIQEILDDDEKCSRLMKELGIEPVEQGKGE